MTQTTVETAPSYLVVPPSRCTAAADRMPWFDLRTFHADPWDLGIRSNTQSTSLLVQRLLGSIARPGLESPYSNLRVAIHEEGAATGPEALNVLYHKCKPALRSRNPRRVLEALVSWVDSYRHGSRSDVVAVNAQAIMRDGRCVLFSHALDRDVRMARRKLIANGLAVADDPIVLIDPVRAEVVIEPPAFSIDSSVLTEADRSIDETDRAVPPGRYPVQAVLVWARKPTGSVMSRARGIYSLAYPAVNGQALGPQTLLDQLVVLSDKVPTLAGGVNSIDVVERAPAALEPPSSGG